jgi:hypothetical protein
MNMKKAYLTLAAVYVLAISTTVYAESGDVSVGVKGGTLGAGIEAGVDLSDNFTLRGGFNYLKFDFNTTISEIDYNFEPEFKNGSLLLDWHPFTNSFRLTAGAYLNSNDVEVEGTYRTGLIPSEYARYADLVDLAKIKGTVDYNTFAPYVGLGWTSNQSNRGWGVSLDLGVMYQGSPDVSELYVDDPWGIGSHPQVTGFLNDQQKAIEDELDKYEYYPVASVSVSYKF